MYTPSVDASSSSQAQITPLHTQAHTHTHTRSGLSGHPDMFMTSGSIKLFCIG